MDDEEEQDFNTEVPESKNDTEEGLDCIIGANVTLQHNGQIVKAKILKRAIGPDGNPIGK